MKVTIENREYKLIVSKRVAEAIKQNKIALTDILSNIQASTNLSKIEDDSFILETSQLIMSGYKEGDIIELEFAQTVDKLVKLHID